MLVPTNGSKEKIKKYEEQWSKIKNLIGWITKKSDGYDEKYMKIKFDTNDELPLNETIKIPIITIAIRAVFNDNN